MRPETQRRILRAVYRACNDLGQLLGRDNLSYSETIALARTYFGSERMLHSFVRNTLAGQILPPETAGTADTNEPDFLAVIDTEEKLEALCAQAPEPEPTQFEAVLSMIDNALPQLGLLLKQRVAQFPHKRGGRPRKLSSIEERTRIREEIKSLRGPGVTLQDVFQRLASRYDVSKSKIKQIWMEGRSTPGTSE